MALRRHDLGPATVWCESNKARLEKMRSTLPFKLQSQHFVEVGTGARLQRVVGPTPLQWAGPMPVFAAGEAGQGGCSHSPRTHHTGTVCRSGRPPARMPALANFGKGACCAAHRSCDATLIGLHCSRSTWRTSSS